MGLNTNPGSVLVDKTPGGLQDQMLNAPLNKFIPGPCNQNAQNQNQLPSVTLFLDLSDAVIAQTAIFDQLVTLPTPTKRVLVTSFSQIEDYNTPSQYYAGPPPADILNGLWLHLAKLGYPPFISDSGGTTFQNRGTENWIPLFSAGSDDDEPSAVEGIVIEFAQPVTQFYISIALKGVSNEFFNLTFACADSLPRIYWKSQS
jgi:hypothetical protein